MRRGTGTLTLTEWRGVNWEDSPSRFGFNAFVTARNLYIASDRIERDKGVSKFATNTLPAAPLWIDEFVTKSGASRLVLITKDHFYEYDSVNDQWVQRTSSSLGSDDDSPVMGVIWAPDDYYLFACHNYFKYWDGTNFNDVASYNPLALVVFDDRVLIGHTMEGGARHPHIIRWTVQGTFNDFTGTGSGYYHLIETPDWIQSFLVMGDALVIYKERSIWVATTSRATTFRFHLIVPYVGLAAPQLIAGSGDLHFFVGWDNVYAFDGRRAEPIGDVIRRKIFGPESVVNWDYIHRGWAMYVEELDEVWFALPVGDSEWPNFILRYCVHRDVWYTRDFPWTLSNYGFWTRTGVTTWDKLTDPWTEYTMTWDSLLSTARIPVNLLARSDGQVEKYDYISTTDDGSVIEGEFETGDMVVVERRVRLLEIEVIAKGSELTLYASYDGGMTWKFLKTLKLANEVKTYSVFLNKTVQKFRLKGRSSKYFRLTGLTVYYREEQWA